MSLDQRTSRPLVVVALATALCLAGDSMLYIALPVYWREVGLDALWQVGVLLSVNRFIRLPFNPLIGWLYQRISLRTGLLLATLLGAATTFGYGIAKGFFAWLLLRAAWGIGWSFFRIGGLSAVVYCTNGQSRGQAMGLYNGLYRLGSLAGMLLGGLLVPLYGLPALALSFAGMALLGVPLLLRHFHLPSSYGERQLAAAQSPGTARDSARVNGKYRVIASGFCIAMLIQGVLAATLSALIERFHGSQLDLFGLLLSATALSGILQALRWSWEPWLGRRFGAWSDGPGGRSRLYGWTLLGAALSFGSMASGLPLLPWIAVTLLVMLLATALTTLTDALASDAASAGNVVAFMTRYSIAQDLGAALGPLLAYLLIGLVDGFAWLYWGGSLIYLLLALSWLGRK
ncbi:MFS transporter [Phytopseudomonas dryadis]|uniref:MFS transporter n=1 Tax=Phytopseudomonas dryadis TaxID=2487520 RepID=A0A4Q9R0S0_9GAMM|nr:MULTISPECIES: MFS transporter [Pseudomonas]TBU92548.1 MFS transporter [Pseudomonas dryadis]TBV03038.1 MFS transporter [Pseudomonas dryadis]TBV17685.1 MFS transporter [Pseudomonas sp. FRB 230]